MLRSVCTRSDLFSNLVNYAVSHRTYLHSNLGLLVGSPFHQELIVHNWRSNNKALDRVDTSSESCLGSKVAVYICDAWSLKEERTQTRGRSHLCKGWYSTALPAHAAYCDNLSLRRGKQTDAGSPSSVYSSGKEIRYVHQELCLPRVFI